MFVQTRVVRTFLCVDRWLCIVVLAKFPAPVYDHFQYKIRWRKAWEIWSHAVPSGRNMVGTLRAVPSEESRRPVLCCLSKMLDVRAFARQMIDTIWTFATNGKISIPPSSALE